LGLNGNPFIQHLLDFFLAISNFLQNLTRMFPNQRGATADLGCFPISEYGGLDEFDLSFLGILNFRYDFSLLNMGVLNDLIDLHEPAAGDIGLNQ
jgi:hypothetical protein